MSKWTRRHVVTKKCKVRICTAGEQSMKHLVWTILFVASTASVAVGQEKAAAPPTLRNADVVKLVALGVSDDTVIAVIRETSRRVFDTSNAGIIALRSNGISARVIAAMQGQTVPPRPPSPDERVDRSKFDSVYRAASAVESAVATNVLDRQLEPLIAAFKAESAAAAEHAATRAERELANKFDQSRVRFEQGVAARDLSRYDLWKTASSMLDEANKIYLGR